jgi:hypothetical protein
MNRYTILICIFIISLSSLANAANSEWEAWKKQLEDRRGIKVDAIETITKEYQDKHCSAQTTEEKRKACVAVYGLVIARRREEIAMIDAFQRAANVPAELRDTLLKDIVQMAEYTRFDAETGRLFLEANKIFAEPKSGVMAR